MKRSVTGCAAIALGFAAAWLAAPRAQTAEIEGVTFADRHVSGDAELRLTGLGLLRYRIFIKGYVAALYLGDEVGPERVLEDVPRRLEIEYFWSIPAAMLADTMTETLERNLDPPTFATLRERIAQLADLYENVEPGDRYSLTYVPGVGTELALNGEPRGVVEGADFSSALFAIWLGERPVDKRLREQLLARRR